MLPRRGGAWPRRASIAGKHGARRLQRWSRNMRSAAVVLLLSCAGLMAAGVLRIFVVVLR